MSKSIGFLLPFIILLFSSLGIALVEEQPRVGLGTQLSKLKDQCQNVKDQLACYELGIDLILGLTTEEILAPEEAPPVIQNTEVFNNTDEARFSFSGDINGFEFKYSFHSITDLRYTCFSQDIGVPEKINDYQIGFFVDGERKFLITEASDINSKYGLCEKFYNIAVDQGQQIPANHLPGIVITGNLYKEGYWFPFLVQYESLEHFESECVDQYKGSKFYDTHAFYLAIHTEIEDSVWHRYTSSSGGSWNSVTALCSAVKNTVRKLIPADRH